MEFKSKDEIMKYLEDNREAIDKADTEKAGPLLAPIFASEITNDPVTMMEIYRWIDLELDCNFGHVVRSNQHLLKDANLNLYKFKILCEYRGALDEEQFVEDTVKSRPHDEYIMEAAKHKDFPVDGREVMYAIHNSVDYVSQEAQEMFIF